MKFRCQTCGARITHPGNIQIGGLQLINQTTGEAIDVPMGNNLWEMKCPVCGQKATAINQHTVRDEDGRELVGFADTPEGIEALKDALADLRRLSGNPSAEQIADTIERTDPSLRPVADYIREHHHELAGLGISLLSLVIALMAWLMPRGQDPKPVPIPSGITEHDLDRLANELRDATPNPATEPSDEGADNSKNSSSHSQRGHRGGTQDGLDQRHDGDTSGRAG